MLDGASGRHMPAGKLAGILRQSLAALPDLGEVPFTVEFGHANAALSRYHVGRPQTRDGRLDVLVNSENATWYRNCEDRDGKVVLKKVGNLAKRNVAGHTSSPTARMSSRALLFSTTPGRIW